MKRRNATRSGAVWRLGLILLLAAALWPLSLRAEAPIGRFVIGVWSPAGWSGAGDDYDSYDRFFTASDATHLSNLGVNLLVQTPRIGHKDRSDFMAVDPDNRELEDAHEIMQALEDTILTLFKAHGGLVVEQSAAEDLPEENPAPGDPTTYTSKFPTGDRLIDFAGVSTTIDAHKLEQQAIALSGKWGNAPYEAGFFGYFIGHEQHPKWGDDFQGGIYDSTTYDNLGRVIDAIRLEDNERAIVAVGRVNDTEAWTDEEQEAFRKVFFRSDMESPANIIMNEQYVFHCATHSETQVQSYLDQLTGANGSLTRTRDMVNAARGENPPRKAEWYHIINVNHEYQCGEIGIPNSCWTGTRPGSVPSSPHRRRPTPAELSVQAYMALARGATGIVYYSHTTNGLASMSDACIDDDLGTEDPLSAMTNCKSGLHCQLPPGFQQGLVVFRPDAVFAIRSANAHAVSHV